MNRYIRRRKHTKRRGQKPGGVIGIIAACLVAGTVAASGYYGFTQFQEQEHVQVSASSESEDAKKLADGSISSGSGEQTRTTAEQTEADLSSHASTGQSNSPGTTDETSSDASTTRTFGSTDSTADKPGQTNHATRTNQRTSAAAEGALAETSASSAASAQSPGNTGGGGGRETTTAAPAAPESASGAGQETSAATGSGTGEGNRETPAAQPEPTAADTDQDTSKPNPGPEGGGSQGGQENSVKAKLASMTLEQKVAQLFVVTPEQLTGAGRVTSAGQVSLDILRQYPVGGMIYFSSNMQNQSQLSQMTAAVQSYAMQIEGLPLFVATDEEGGARSNIAGKSSMGIAPTAGIAAIGATQDAAQAYGVGSYIGQYMHNLGFNMNLAPVADVLTNSSNDVIKGRSFGTDAGNVSAMTNQMLKGMRDQQVYGVMKHFPGHGATDSGRLNGFPYTNKSLEELMQAEMIPFKQAIDQGVSFIMAGHITAPNVTGDQVPCSLSGVMINQVLRGQLGYQGIVVTDALNTPAVQRAYSSEQACVIAIQAGADILLMPKNFHRSYETVLQAVQNGIITEERIDQSVERILTVKMGMQ